MTNRTDAQAAIDGLIAKQGVPNSITPTSLATERLQVMLDNSAMTDEGALFAASSGIPVYQWNTDTSATDPGTGFVKANNSDMSLITEVYVSETLDNGIDLSLILGELSVGDIFSISDFTTLSNYLSLQITREPTSGGGWVSYGVSVTQSNGVFGNFEEVSVKAEVINNKATVIKSLANSVTNADYDASPQTKLSESKVLGYTGAKISFSFEPMVSSTLRSIAVGLFINGVLVDSEFEVEMKDNRNNLYPCKVFDYTLNIGSNLFEVKFGRRNGGGNTTVAIKNVRLIIEEL